MLKQNVKIKTGLKLPRRAVLRKLEEKSMQLEIANQRLESITYALNHNLQEPMRKIQIFSDIILKEEEKNLSEKGRYVLERMLLTSNSLRSLLKDMLAHSAIEHTSEQK